MPFAPGRFSTINVPPKAPPNSSAIMRAKGSELPPGAEGTMTFTGRAVGQVCARIVELALANSAINKTAAAVCERVGFVPLILMLSPFWICFNQAVIF